MSWFYPKAISPISGGRVGWQEGGKIATAQNIAASPAQSRLRCFFLVQKISAVQLQLREVEYIAV